MIDAVIRCLRRNAPYAPALSMAEGDVSFARLDTDVEAMAGTLVARFGEGPRVARVEVRNVALAWVVAAAAQRIGWTAGFARSGSAVDGFGPEALVLSDVGEGTFDGRIVRLDASFLTPQGGGPSVAVPTSQDMMFDRADGGMLRLSGATVETRIGEVDWLLPTGDRMASLIGPETPFGLAVVLRQWMKGGAVCPPTQKAPLAGLGTNRRLDLLVLRPSDLVGLLEALPPDAAPLPGLRLVVYGGRAPRALTLAARLRLAAEVVLVHGDDAQGLYAMGVDTVARQDEEIGPLAPWLDGPEVAFAPGVRLNADGVVAVQERAAP